METVTKQANMLVLNEEQQLLQESARDFLKEKSPVSAFRALRDSNNPLGYDEKIWQEMISIGWTGMLVPENYGGLDFGHVGMGILMEESGRFLAPSPLFATALLGVTLLKEAGNEGQKSFLLPDMAEGKTTVSLALEEGNHHRPPYIQTTAQQEGDHFVIQGQKKYVIEGQNADQIIVAARTSGNPGEENGISLFIVPADTAGLSRKKTVMVDYRNYAELTFDGLKVPSDALLGTLDQGFAPLQKTLDIANIHLAAELSGLMQEAFERTIAYLKERKQFGVPIGSFQGLQHRAADLYCHIEMAQSVVLKALMAIDQNADNLSLMASLAKGKVSETAQRVTNEAIQMFGGIGVTDDEEIGFFLKRARAVQQTFGDQSYHMDRFARLRGY